MTTSTQTKPLSLPPEYPVHVTHLPPMEIFDVGDLLSDIADDLSFERELSDPFAGLDN